MIRVLVVAFFLLALRSDDMIQVLVVAFVCLLGAAAGWTNCIMNMKNATLGGARGDPVHQRIILGVPRAPREVVNWWWHLPPLCV